MSTLILTPGEPAGIGPDIVLQAAQHDLDATLIVVADPDLLRQRAEQLGINIKLYDWQEPYPCAAHLKQHLKVKRVSLTKPVTPGVLVRENAAYVLETLKQATTLCLEHKDYALVTGPVQKSIMNEAGIPFTGHTEFLEEYCQVPMTLMLFVVDALRVALVTTHLPLHQVAQAITKTHLEAILNVLQAGLVTHFNLTSPCILVCGLNPHAGENGYLGTEEIEVITPVLNQLRKNGFDLVGPLPADTIFTPPFLKKADAILAMYHDQALPVVKYLGFGKAVNVTLGLPFIRTSVDHGTALDKAATGKADVSSLMAAIELALKLSNRS